MRIFGFIIVLIFAAQGALAQSTYKSWNNPDSVTSTGSSESRLQEFVDKLNEMVNKADRARAADPTFLRDLRNLARDFNRPWQKLILNDQFLDGNYEVNPTWQVIDGEYWVENGWGLRSAVKPRSRTTNNQPNRQQNQDAAVAILGQILNQAMGNTQNGETQQANSNSRALIHTATTIPNTFALETRFSSWTDEGRFIMTMYQGYYGSRSRPKGYRLAYTPGGGLELIRVNARGTLILDTATLSKPLEDKKFHDIEWLRYPDGRMTVNIDGKEVLSASDRGFRDPFDGLALINRGGDYILKQIKISGRP